MKRSYYEKPNFDEELKNHVLEQVLDTEKFKAFYLKKPGEGRMMSTMLIFSPEGIVLLGDLTPARNGNVSVLGYGLGWFANNLSGSYLCEKFLTTGWHHELAERDLRIEAADVLRGERDDGPWMFSEEHRHPDRTQKLQLGAVAEERKQLVEDLKEELRTLKAARAEKDQDSEESAQARISTIRAELAVYHPLVKALRKEIADKLIELAGSVGCGDLGPERFVDRYDEIDTSGDHEGLPGWGYPPNEAAWLIAIQKAFAREYQKAHPDFKADAA